jgi:hypothetical protein
LYKHFRDNTKGFSELAAFPASEQLFGVRRSGSSEAAESYPGEFVSGNYFAMFGIRAYAGRTLTARDDDPDAPPAAVMSYRLWQQRYGSDPSVIGSVFNLNDKPFTVVGIAPPGFFGDALRPNPPDFFLPLTTEPLVQIDADLNKYDTHWLALIGRIQPGATAASIETEMRVELKQWLRSHWSEMSANERARFPDQTLYLSPGGAGITSMRQRYEHWLQILMMVSGFALLIVCANVANLMLVRGMERRRQTAMSMALGARASRIVRQALTESIVLSLCGGAAGLAIAFAGTRLILHFAFPSLPAFAGVPIDASGELADGSKVDGVVSLRQALVSHPDVFVGSLTEKLLTYALGRGLDYYDMPAVRKIQRDAAAQNNRFSSIVLGIVNSVPFQMRATPSSAVSAKVMNQAPGQRVAAQ